MIQQTHQLVPSWANQLAVLGGDDAQEIRTLPPWLTSALEVPRDFPLRVGADHPLAPLPLFAREIAQNRLPVSNFLLELRGPDGSPVGILLHGKWEDDLSAVVPGGPAEPGVLLALRDVTDVLLLQRKAAAVGAFHGIVGQSLPMLEVFHKIATYGPTEAPVIITGETGTGKELVARAMHERSRRGQGPFVAVNCVALTSDLFESELFGHEKGSFTGAYRQHKGRFQRADGGTLFLDEIGDMPSLTQAKMLRALEDGIVERVGGEREERVDVRVLAATNVALEEAVRQRRFRADLYHRLSVLRIHVPALRERHGDLPLLVQHYLEIFNRRYEKQIVRMTPEALAMMEDYHWPGNVRELRNVMERLVIETQGEAIGAKALARWMEERDYVMPGEWNADSLYQRRPTIIPQDDAVLHRDPPRAGDAFWGVRPSWPAENVVERPMISMGDATPPEAEPQELTEESIRTAFANSKGNVTGAARSLGVHKATLYRHMKKLGLSREELEAADQT